MHIPKENGTPWRIFSHEQLIRHVLGVTEIENLKAKRRKQVFAMVTATLKIKIRKQEPVIKKLIE